MQVVFLLKDEPDQTIRTVMEQADRQAEIIVVDLREEQDYDALVETIAACDLVLTW